MGGLLVSRKSAGSPIALDRGSCILGRLQYAAEKKFACSKQPHSRMLCGWLHPKPDRWSVQLNT